MAAACLGLSGRLGVVQKRDGWEEGAEDADLHAGPLVRPTCSRLLSTELGLMGISMSWVPGS